MTTIPVKYVSKEEVYEEYKKELQERLENIPQMVRGVVTVQFGRGGLLMKPDPLQPNLSYDTVVAYTPWRRHDDPFEYVIEEREALYSIYRKMKGFQGALMDFEYRSYKNTETDEYNKEYPIHS